MFPSTAVLLMAASLAAHQEPFVGVPPMEAWSPANLRSAVLAANATTGQPVRANISYDTLKKRVILAWRKRLSGFFDERVAAHRNYGVRYWPTAVLALSTDRILVSGRRTNGRTVVELWTLSPPEIVSSITPGGTSAETMVLGTRTVDEVMDTGDSQQNTIQHMWLAKNTTTEKVLVHFWSSKDIALLEVATGTVEIQVTGTIPQPGVLHEPLLTQRWVWAMGPLDHQDHGVVYILRLTEDIDDHDPTVIDRLLVVDSDRDGDLDLTWPMSAADFEANGFNDPSRYQ